MGRADIVYEGRATTTFSTLDRRVLRYDPGVSKRGMRMRIGLRVLGFVMIGMGTVWILQGINILPGSFMTGQMAWAYRGAAVAVVGLIVLVYAFRRSTP